MSSQSRLIPARAGNTIVCNTIHFERRAHPRSRGEHPGAVTESPGDQGSSPLARGTLLRYMNIIAQAGLIPSPEGNTVTAPRRMTYSRAHPRSRGEHGSIWDLVHPSTGSSPLARGTLWRVWRLISAAGLIPARAGNTECHFHGAMAERAHPRSRGEHSVPQNSNTGRSGSSPLARGTPSTTVLSGRYTGLIPARAGNTRRSGSQM